MTFLINSHFKLIYSIKLSIKVIIGTIADYKILDKIADIFFMANYF